MSILLLGGTADARRVAQALHEQGVMVIYSVAGMVRMPQVSCRVISGGFTQVGGLRRYVEQVGIRAILDITHPFAQKMSSTAVEVARSCAIPCWRFHRQPWLAQAGDRWQAFDSWQALIPALADKRAVFLSAGQLTPAVLDALVKLPQPAGAAPGEARHFLLRTAVAPTVALPANMHWVKAIGPFSEADEQRLMQEYAIDALVSKNSGGDATAAKLAVARQMGIPVYMLQRPDLPAADREYDDESRCVQAVVQWCREQRLIDNGKTGA